MANSHTSFGRDDAHTDSDNEGGTPRTSIEQARRELEEEEEREKLLSQTIKHTDDGFYQRLESGGRKRKSKGKPGPRSDNDEKRELLYEMEEGGPRSTTPLSNSSEDDQERIGVVHAGKRKSSLATKICKYTVINVVIAAVFIVIAFGAYKATWDVKYTKSSKVYRSNGTHLFAPTTILVSLDGFRADFLQRGLTPTLNAFIREGVSPKYMTPSFPSVTFPNHYTLVTGLYPESHGVVGNTFWDPDLKEEFYYTHANAMEPKWWGGEPLWVTAEKQGVRVATHMWPGSEAHIGGDIEPAFIDKYNGSEVLPAKVDRIFDFIDNPGARDEHASMTDELRANLVLAYVPNVDADGHLYGPNSTEIRATITDVDTMLGQLFDGLRERNLTDVVNVVVVSDHGMATTSVDRIIQFEDLLDPDQFDHIDGWPHYGLRPRNPAHLEEMHSVLQREAEVRDGFDVYLKEDMPERYHFSNNDRIAPLWIIPRTGWAIATRKDFDVARARETGEIYHPRGIHGYDHEHPLMRAIFVARGPSFPHAPGSRVDVFQNIEVYNILCDSIGVTPEANNGTLRLPLKPDGVHGEDIFDGEAPAQDPPETSASAATSTSMLPAGETVAPGETLANGETPGEDDEYLTDIDDHYEGGTGEQLVDVIDDNGDIVQMSWADWLKLQVAGLRQWIHDTFQQQEEQIAPGR